MATTIYLEKLRELLLDTKGFTREQVERVISAARGYAGGKSKGMKGKTFPYTRLDQLPDQVKVLPEAAQKVWMQAFNVAVKEDGSNDQQAIRIAWTVVKRAGYQKVGDTWKKASELDDDKVISALGESTMNKFPFLSELEFSEDVATGQVFPKIGKYKHERYGEINITKEFLDEVKKNFDQKVYQQDLPLTIDIEHQPSLSGAVGEFEELEIRGDKGMWAKAKLNDRGKTLLGDNRFKYFSPEFYDQWQDPASEKKYSNLLTGGALCVKPFFKGMQPWALMSEGNVWMFSEYEPESEMVQQAKTNTDATTSTVYIEPEDVHVDRIIEPNDAAETKTEDGNSYPSQAYLVVPDKEKPSTWKLRVWETPEKKVTRAQLGRAAAAFSPGGFRGQKVQLDPDQRKSALSKLRGLYGQIGIKPDELPRYIRASIEDAGVSEPNEILKEMGFGGETMTEDEVRQMNEMQTSLEEMKSQLKEMSEEKESAQKQLDEAKGRIDELNRASTRRELSEIVRESRLAFQGQDDELLDRLERMKASLTDEDFEQFVNEKKALHEQLKDSALFDQKTNQTPVETGTEAEYKQKVDELVANGMDAVEASVKVASENPELYNKLDKEHKEKARRGGDL